MAKVAEKVPSWVARILLPELRSIVKEEFAAEVKRVEEKMSGEITALRTDIKRIEEKMWSEIAALRTDIKRVEEKISSELKRVEEKMSSEIAAIRSDIKRVEDTLSTRVDSLEKRLDLVKQVAVLEAKVKELEAKQGQKS